MVRMIAGFLLVALIAGCGSDKTVIPTKELTEEQKKAIKAEDAKVAQEEGGNNGKTARERNDPPCRMNPTRGSSFPWSALFT